VQTAFAVRGYPSKLQVTSYGEIVVVTTEGDTLFNVYSPDGKLLRSFGKRIDYGDSIANAELSDGHFVADRSGGFYFSFNYPPLIQHYARSGRLISEFKPASDVAIAPPDIKSSRQGNRLTVTSRYQILVLDVALDVHGHLLLLMSGENKFQALMHGSRTLVVMTGAGKVLSRTAIDEASFNRLTVDSDVLYLLRNRDPLRLERYSLP
jgi:hypothetical protein